VPVVKTEQIARAISHLGLYMLDPTGDLAPLVD
jgi:hypothetical protein